MTRLVLYLAAPLRPTDAEIEACAAAYGDRHRAAATVDALKANLARAMRWLAWLRRSFPEVTFVAPWIAAVLSGEDDSDQAQREAGRVDADAIVLVGGRVSSGMARGREMALRVWDLTALGAEPAGDIGPAAWLEWGEVFETRPSVQSTERIAKVQGAVAPICTRSEAYRSLVSRPPLNHSRMRAIAKTTQRQRCSRPL